MNWKFPFLQREQAQPAPQTDPLTSQLVVRMATAEDLPAMEWDGEYRHFRRVFADAYRRMQRGQTILWLSELRGVGLVGQVFIQLVCDRPELADGRERAYLYSFRVKKQYRSQGIGSRMMDEIEADLARRNFAYVTLNVARDNPRAQQLYVRRGYYVVAPEPGIWSYQDEQGRWQHVEEPAWRMEKRL